MSIITWKMDPEREGALVQMDEEEAAEEMWREICIEKGLPADTPYVISNDFQSMTWRESVCDGMWREIYARRGLLPNTFSSDDDDDEEEEDEEEETEKKRNVTPLPPPVPPPENYRKVSYNVEDDRKMLEARFKKLEKDKENKNKNKKKKKKTSTA